MMLIDLLELKKNLKAVFAQVEAGEEIIVTKDGNPFAKIEPIHTQQGERKFGTAPNIWIADDFDEPLDCFKEYME